jgi:hypothetical protein
VVAARVSLPAGVAVDWTEQFEHEATAWRTLSVVLPLVFASIFVVLHWIYRDLPDAVLMLLAVPRVIAGGVRSQWLLGYPFSVTVWAGYIACFGMATSTGIFMLVNLRQTVASAGGLERLDPEMLRGPSSSRSVTQLVPCLPGTVRWGSFSAESSPRSRPRVVPAVRVIRRRDARSDRAALDVVARGSDDDAQDRHVCWTWTTPPTPYRTKRRSR